jgi:hypothetical protein
MLGKVWSFKIGNYFDKIIEFLERLHILLWFGNQLVDHTKRFRSIIKRQEFGEKVNCSHKSVF